MMRNEAVHVTEILIPEFYPNICVLDDEDYAKAREILQQQVFDPESRANEEIACSSCNEVNPGSFDICYQCGHDLPSQMEA